MIAVLLAVLGVLVSARSTADGTPDLSCYRIEAGSETYARLDPILVEISGLAATGDGRLFANNDEQGIVFQLDPATGAILKRFRLDTPPVAADFEGLCSAHGRLYMSTSAGDIYEFTEGDDGEAVAYTIHRTGLGNNYELEGLCYDPATDALLLSTKRPFGSNDRRRPVFSFSLVRNRLDPAPRFTPTIDELAPEGRKKAVFNPSSIERHPATGTFFLLAAQGHAIAELSPSGEVLRSSRLDTRLFTKPEGLAFMPDGTMYISSEGKKSRPAALGAYPLAQR